VHTRAGAPWRFPANSEMPFPSARAAYHRRSLAPSYLTSGWQCAGSFARADLIDVHAGTADDVAVVFRSARRTWGLIGRGKVCEDAEIPARLWYFACAVN
jgi:hypothetical protein